MFYAFYRIFSLLILPSATFFPSPCITDEYMALFSPLYTLLFLQLFFLQCEKKRFFSVRLVFTMGTKALGCLCFYFGTKYRLERKHGSCFTSVDFEYIDLCIVSHAAFNVWLWLQTCENIFLFFHNFFLMWCEHIFFMFIILSDFFFHASSMGMFLKNAFN